MFTTASSTFRRSRRSPARCALPGSKSISNRVLLLAGAARGHDDDRTACSHSDDTRVMLEALRRSAAGIEARRRGATRASPGLGGAARCAQQATLFLGNAGTAMRPLAAALACSPRARRRFELQRRAAHARAADRRPGRCAARARLPRSTTSAATAIPPLRIQRRAGARARRADPRARRRLEPVPHRAAAGAAAACADARRRRSRSTAS